MHTGSLLWKITFNFENRNDMLWQNNYCCYVLSSILHCVARCDLCLQPPVFQNGWPNFVRVHDIPKVKCLSDSYSFIRKFRFVKTSTTSTAVVSLCLLHFIAPNSTKVVSWKNTGVKILTFSELISFVEISMSGDFGRGSLQIFH